MRRYWKLIPPILGLLCGADITANESEGSSAAHVAHDDWPYYNGNPASTHYSTLSDINTRNVAQLALAWTYDTKDPPGYSSTIESNPLVVAGQLFFVSPNGRLICLDAATGSERWIFDPGASAPEGQVSWRRGVSYWSDGNARRILFTFRNSLYSVDALTGLADANFGNRGQIDLATRVASPGAIFEDSIIVGGTVSTIRAFNVRTGQLQWTFHTIPRPGEFGYETWPKDAWKTASGANNWGGMTVDAKRGVVYVPLAFPQSLYGADRPGDNLFANCLLALDAVSGKRLWHFQTVRHDVWDWDLPAPPALVRVRMQGRLVDAVALVTKHGFVFVLDRDTGTSLFPLAQKPAFASDLPGEVMAKTQLEPVAPEPFARQRLTEDMLTDRTPEANAAARAWFKTLRSRGLWDTPSEQGTIIFPGLEGGAEWGGASYDPTSGWLYVNSTELASIIRMKKLAVADASPTVSLYRTRCASCHGANREGHPPEFPSLLGVGERLSFNQIVTRIAGGGARMPAFQVLATEYTQIWSLVRYLQTGVDPLVGLAPVTHPSTSPNDVYIVDELPKFVDPDGYPATKPPWGALNAIDLNTGRYTWKIPLGEYPLLAAKGITNTGSENFGGSIVTGGGLLFIGATSFDKKFRAFDKRTGRLLWETTLPAAGNATPSTYRVNGRQFVVIPAGGGRPTTAESGTKIVAYALPQSM